MRLFSIVPLFAVLLSPVLVLADQPHNIFDDDWTPPKATESSPRPTNSKTPTPTATTGSGPLKTTATSIKPTDSTATPATPVPTAPADTRRPVPTKAELAPVRTTMREVFATELADRSIDGRRRLAAALMAQADKSGDLPTDRFVLLSAAIDAAVDSADLTTAFASADRLAKSFVVDGLGIKAEAATARGPKPPSSEVAAANVQAALDLAGDLAAVDDFATAHRVCAAVQPSAAGDASLRMKIQQ